MAADGMAIEQLSTHTLTAAALRPATGQSQEAPYDPSGPPHQRVPSSLDHSLPDRNLAREPSVEPSVARVARKEGLQKREDLQEKLQINAGPAVLSQEEVRRLLYLASPYRADGQIEQDNLPLPGSIADIRS